MTPTHHKGASPNLGVLRPGLVNADPMLSGLQFPERTVLYVHECAARLRVSSQHIIDLIEEGALGAYDVGGNADVRRVPGNFFGIVAREWGQPETHLRMLLEKARKSQPRARCSWRIPTAAWTAFLDNRNTLRRPV